MKIKLIAFGIAKEIIAASESDLEVENPLRYRKSKKNINDPVP